MTLANYINDLLYRYDCVIVPNFGGFITNIIGANVSAEKNTFYPPKKQITFNVYLQHNDGLLANYIASSENFIDDLFTFVDADDEFAPYKIFQTVKLYKMKRNNYATILNNILIIIKKKHHYNIT